MMTKLLFFTTLIFLLSGCKKNNNTSPLNSSQTYGQIIPLKIGNSWNYREINYNFSSTDTTYYTSTVISDTIIGGEHWYIYQFSDPGSGLLSINRGDGLYYHAFGSGRIVYKYPASINESYMDFLADTVKVESINLGVTVPAGTFSCYHYKITNMLNNSVASYLSPDIGLIKKEMFSSGNISLRVELLSYHLN